MHFPGVEMCVCMCVCVYTYILNFEYAGKEIHKQKYAPPHQNQRQIKQV